LAGRGDGRWVLVMQRRDQLLACAGDNLRSWDRTAVLANPTYVGDTMSAVTVSVDDAGRFQVEFVQNSSHYQCHSVDGRTWEAAVWVPDPSQEQAQRTNSDGANDHPGGSLFQGPDGRRLVVGWRHGGLAAWTDPPQVATATFIPPASTPAAQASMPAAPTPPPSPLLSSSPRPNAAPTPGAQPLTAPTMPASPARNPLSSWWWIALGLGALTGGGAAWWWYRRRAALVVPDPSAQERP
jgi:hypothetical protein